MEILETVRILKTCNDGLDLPSKFVQGIRHYPICYLLYNEENLEFHGGATRIAVLKK